MNEEEMFNLLDLVMKQQNLLNLLKEKKVDLGFIAMNMEDMSILKLTEEYNGHLFWRDIERHLTLEEMQQIVDLLKEE